MPHRVAFRLSTWTGPVTTAYLQGGGQTWSGSSKLPLFAKKRDLMWAGDSSPLHGYSLGRSLIGWEETL